MMVWLGAMSATEANRTIDAIWRLEAPRLVAGLMRLVRDVGVAEDLAHDALVAALEQWPGAGIPDRPGAWLMSTAKHHALNLLNRSKMAQQKHQELGQELDAAPAPDLDAALDDDIGDDLLRLVFTACHPILSTEARVALTLRLLCGLTTEEIARAFLVPEPTIAQRIVRAKRTLKEARVPFEVPRGDDRGARLASVLEVVYLVFNEGFSATSGDDWMRPALWNEALRLVRIIAGLAPGEAEVQGLVALLELNASRAAARVGPSGEPIPLLEQNRARWDQLFIERGLAALALAKRLGGARGPYAMQAAIAACHARARAPDQTDWRQIAALCQELVEVLPSPIVELNRAVAVGHAFGPAAALEIADALATLPSLQGYHLVAAVRGDCLARLGRLDEARTELERAAALTRNTRERDVLVERAKQLTGR